LSRPFSQRLFYLVEDNGFEPMTFPTRVGTLYPTELIRPLYSLFATINPPTTVATFQSKTFLNGGG
ncbi:MAG: hypothetical protein JJU34_05710, partial [Lunatimonas sp.]|uniref:hypothetical protein n=1 Tax=Lunatimonas sp. TaxID=2060141 RepID=UPI00263BE79F